MDETMRTMGELVDAGKVRHVGVSNFSVPELQDARRALGGRPIVCNQVLYNLFSREAEDALLPYCQAHQVTVIACTPLAGGRLDQELQSRPRLAQMLDQICIATAKACAQVLIAWCVHHPWVVTIPQTNRVQRVEENCAASGWSLTPEQYVALTEAAS
jgi:diketogulonate reductase-like aldo/keto reductase